MALIPYDVQPAWWSPGQDCSRELARLHEPSQIHDEMYGRIVLDASDHVLFQSLDYLEPGRRSLQHRLLTVSTYLAMQLALLHIDRRTDLGLFAFDPAWLEDIE